jgi:hypothetical protein
MPGIFISYRRADSSAITGRIYDRLVTRYGRHSVFLDIDGVPIAMDFRAHVQTVLQSADVTIAVIGQRWIDADSAGTARILDEADLVRVEVETALARGMPLVPVLVDGARMPASAELPASLGRLPSLNAAEVATGRDFDVHMDRLLAVIDRILSAHPAESPKVAAGEEGGAVAESKTVAQAPGARSWSADLLEYLVVPLVMLLVAHHLIINKFDYNPIYLYIVSYLVPFAFGFLLAWQRRSGTVGAFAFATALGLVGDAGMVISEGLNSGQPIIPATREEWGENIETVVGIALSFMVGHASVRALRVVLRRRLSDVGKTGLPPR